MLPLTLDDLADAYSRVSVANKLALDEFEIVGSTFNRQGIEFILLKGGDLISRLYGVRGARPISDIDLLVFERDLPKIDGILKDLGHTLQIDGNPAYSSPRGALLLDLTTTLWYLRENALQAVWARTIVRSMGRVQVRCMCPNDLLLYLTAYAVLHRGHFSPSFSNDIALLLRKEPVDWAVVTREAMRHKLTIPLRHALRRVLMERPSTFIPRLALELLEPSCWTERGLAAVLSKVVTHRAIPDVGHVLLFLSTPLTQKARWIWTRFFPSVRFLAYRYGEHSDKRVVRIRLMRLCALLTQGAILCYRIMVRLLSRESSTVRS